MIVYLFVCLSVMSWHKHECYGVRMRLKIQDEARSLMTLQELNNTYPQRSGVMS